MKMLKFECMIDSIQDKLGSVVDEPKVNPFLALIYDYDQINDYGKVIMTHARFWKELYITFTNKNEKKKNAERLLFYCEKGRLPEEKERSTSGYNSSSRSSSRINAIFRSSFSSLSSLSSLYGSDSPKNKYEFIFWSLMILVVDKTDMEKHLSLICDFAQKLSISSADMTDMARLVEGIYCEKLENFNFHSSEVERVFDKVVELYTAD